MSENQQASEAVEKIAREHASKFCGCPAATSDRWNINDLWPHIAAAIAQALQSRDAENAQDKTAREIAWETVEYIRKNNAPIEGSYLVNYITLAIERGAAQSTQRLNERVRELEWALQREIQRDGKWIDRDGACRVCGGEIPSGHSDDCDYYKLGLERDRISAELARVKKLLKELRSHINCCNASRPETRLDWLNRIDAIAEAEGEEKK